MFILFIILYFAYLIWYTNRHHEAQLDQERERNRFIQWILDNNPRK